MQHAQPSRVSSLASVVPADRAGRLAWLRLARSRNVGPASFRHLMARFRGARAALDALPGLAAKGGSRAYRPADPDQVEAELTRAEDCGAQMLCLGSDMYPAGLAGIADPPPVIWARGDVSLAASLGLAIVGARNASATGLRMAKLLTEGLAEQGYVIVSGLARGVDTQAHRVALNTGTVAVLAGGVDEIYPSENTDLAADIAAHGLLLSEAPMGVAPQARHFPRRNRLISGMSHAVILIEAAARSGSLITAQAALEQGRDVLAVPGAPLDPRAAGCNRLIRDGAVLIRSVEDIVEAIGVTRGGMPEHFREPREDDLFFEPALPEEPAPDTEPETGTETDRLMTLVSTAPVAEDQLIRHLGQPASVVLRLLVELDLAGKIVRHPGGMVSRAV